MRKNNLDILKLICAFMVVCIHTTIDNELSSYIDCFCRCAVPIFLMITGYYLYNNSPYKIKKKGLKIIFYFIKYEFIYIIFNFIMYILKNKNGFISALTDELKHCLIAPRFGSHLWYLSNLIFIYLIIYIFNRINKLKLLFITGCLLYPIGVIASNILTLPISLTRNFLFLELFYVMLGMLIRRNKLEDISVNKYILLGIGLIFGLLQIVEKELWIYYFNSSFKDYFFTTIICSLCLLIFTLKCNEETDFLKNIAPTSSLVYFLHPIYISILGSLFDRNSLLINILFTLTVIFISVIISIIIQKINFKNTKKSTNTIAK